MMDDFLLQCGVPSCSIIPVLYFSELSSATYTVSMYASQESHKRKNVHNPKQQTKDIIFFFKRRTRKLDTYDGNAPVSS